MMDPRKYLGCMYENEYSFQYIIHILCMYSTHYDAITLKSIHLSDWFDTYCNTAYVWIFIKKRNGSITKRKVRDSG